VYVAGPLLVCCALVWIAAVTTPDGRLHVFFLDVGQGDAILIQKGHTQVLVDGGPDPDDILVELGDRLPFWDRDVELAVLTHPDADHITGMVEVLRVCSVDQALTSGQDGDSATYAEWERLIENRDIPQTVACAGQTITLGDDLRLQVLHPDEPLMSGTYSDVNNNSVVLRLEYGDFSLILTGDIFEEAERDLVEARWGLRSTVLKGAHHGSDTSNCAEFLDAVSPQMAVISVGSDNDFGHPSPDVVARLEEVTGSGVLSTADRGTIELITDGEGLWLRTER
jgi:competence protein ComEC